MRVTLGREVLGVIHPSHLPYPWRDSYREWPQWRTAGGRRWEVELGAAVGGHTLKERRTRQSHSWLTLRAG